MKPEATSLRYLSVCSGIEAATVAWHPLGFQPVAFSEIDKFPCAVLTHHYPQVPNWGDLTKFREWPDADVDVLVGGTPCQSFSVAGLRAGLADPRGNLALTYLAVVDRYRPRWVVWENVPGVLSSDGGRALGAFLGGLGQLGYGFAYRVLDAQYFGLAQRRARVFVVGHLGDWRRAAAVLFERESLSGHPAPRREAGQDVTAGTLRSTDGGSDCDHAAAAHLVADSSGVSGRNTETGSRGRRGGAGVSGFGERERALTTSNQRIDAETETFVVTHSLRADGFDASEDGTGRGTPLVAELAPTLDQRSGRSGANSVATSGGLVAGGVPQAVAFDARQSDVLQYGEKTGPLDTDGHSIAVAFQTRGSNVGVGDASGTIGSNSDRASGGAPMVAQPDTLYNQGINHASTQKTYAGTLLRALREEVGAEAFTQWGLGILDSLLPQEVLRSRLHGCGIRLTADFSRRWMVYHALSRPEAHSEGLLLSMRETECEGCPPPGWQPPEQLARELGAYLSALSHPGPQAQRFMRDLWQASEGVGLLREALSAVQEVGRSAGREGQPVWPPTAGGRSEPAEGVFGGGLPEAVSRERLLHDARAAGAAGNARQASDDQERSGSSTMAVRRLTVEECEFLQGFPRGYTAIPYRGKPAADGPKYKALGNSMAVPVMRWIGRRLAMVDALEIPQEKTA